MAMGLNDLGCKALAVLMMVSVLGVSAVPATTHPPASAQQECEGHDSGGSQVPDQGVPGCDHAPGSPCATMLGCVSTAPALASSLTRVSGGFVVGAPAPAALPSAHGRLALGPAPPPPNS
jgi:hypothetical protein